MTQIQDLTEQQLNTLAALGQGWRIQMKGGYFVDKSYTPCTNWSQAGELVEKYSIAIVPPELSGLENWAAGSTHHYTGKQGRDNEQAKTPLLAIVRAFVASVYGTEVDYDAIVGGDV